MTLNWTKNFLGKCLAIFAVFIAAGHAFGANTSASLILSEEIAKPGDTVMAGIHLKMKTGWHTYWKNPGGSGDATRIKWTLPKGVTAGEILWPVPRVLPDEDFTTYIYKDEVVLIVPLKISESAQPGKLALNATVSWLECEQQCVPGSAEVKAELQVGGESKLSADNAVIAKWNSRVPLPLDASSLSSVWKTRKEPDMRNLLIRLSEDTGATNYDFLPYNSDTYDIKPGIEAATNASGKASFLKAVKKIDTNWPVEIPGILLQHLPNDTEAAYEVTLKPQATETASASVVEKKSTAPGIVVKDERSLLLMLAYAFLGGIILNIMPCVLPVIALKILGFVSETKSNPGKIRRLGLVYGVGVLVSFLALAAMVISVKHFGHAASWGMQFQNSQFVVCMTTLVLLVALNLFGVFEVNPGGRIMGAAGELASGHGYGGAFMNGVLATILATPCTAPFLGYALGFAFIQPSSIIILIFLTIGAGVAAPYVILSWQPGWLKFLPKPGAWMEKFKMAMGFPMLGTVVYLFTLATPPLGNDGDLLLGLFLVMVGFIAFIWGQFVQRGRTGKIFWVAASLVLGFASYAFFLEHELHWRHPDGVRQETSDGSKTIDGIVWKQWSLEAITEARKTGRPILVDFTAVWCPNCRVNFRTSINIPEVRQKLKDINAITFIEDSYTKSEIVSKEILSHQRAGIPLVLVYPKNPASPPEVLPELLTPSTVLNALDKAAQN